MSEQISFSLAEIRYAIARTRAKAMHETICKALAAGQHEVAAPVDIEGMQREMDLALAELRAAREAFRQSSATGN